MFDKLMELLSGGSAETVAELKDDEVRLASAALLVHAARIDGNWTADESAQLTAALKTHYNLSADDLYALLGSADAAEREAIDLYRFTSVLTRHLDQPGRQHVVAMLWSVVLADGEIHEFEDNLVWRVAELLGVSTRDRVRIKKQVQAQLAGADAPIAPAPPSLPAGPSSDEPA
ncbi:MAG: TerB family tellurite resistance protein [Pseudomonadota bacterium]